MKPTVPTPSNDQDDFTTVINKKKGKQSGVTQKRGGFTKPFVGKKFEYQPRQPPLVPKNTKAKKDTSNVASTSGTKVTTSNPFDALNLDEDFCSPPSDTNKEVNDGSKKVVEKQVAPKAGTQDPLLSVVKDKEQVTIPSTSTTSGPSTSSNKGVNPFSKVGAIVDSDIDDEVDEVLNAYDESANLFGGGQNLKDEFGDYDDYDDFDDYAKQIQDLPGELDALNALYGFKLQGRRK